MTVLKSRLNTTVVQDVQAVKSSLTKGQMQPAASTVLILNQSIQYLIGTPLQSQSR